METNMLLLKGKIKERGLTQSDVAERMGIDLCTLNRKINHSNGTGFTIGEMHKISDILGLTADECKAIFLP